MCVMGRGEEEREKRGVSKVGIRTNEERANGIVYSSRSTRPGLASLQLREGERVSARS